MRRGTDAPSPCGILMGSPSRNGHRFWSIPSALCACTCTRGCIYASASMHEVCMDVGVYMDMDVCMDMDMYMDVCV